MLYSIANGIINVILHALFFMRVTGRENIPKSGGLFLCTNHRSYWDPPAVAAAFPRRLRFMAKEELFKNPLFGGLIKALGAFPIRRGKGDAGAVMTALKIVRGGETTLIFPEGKRVVDQNERPKVNPGIIKLAIKARVPIVPGYTNGKYRLFGGLKVYFGKPVSYEQYYDAMPDAPALERLTDELMEAIYSHSEADVK